MLRHPLALLCAWTATASACSCVPFPSARQAMASADLVFRGSVTSVSTLPQHPRMGGRQRYAITFQVKEYWQGTPPTQSITLYDLDPGTDCMGGAGFQTGRTYLVFASAGTAKEYQLDTSVFWHGWTDVLPPGTPMFVPQVACMPGGDTSLAAVRKHLHQLGRGTTPKRS